MAILAEDSFDLILLDLDLPDSRGLETLKQVHARYPHLSILVLTGIGDEDIAGQGLSIAHRIIVQNHLGQLSVESDPGQGTTFIIKLPVGDGECPLV